MCIENSHADLLHGFCHGQAMVDQISAYLQNTCPKTFDANRKTPFQFFVCQRFRILSKFVLPVANRTASNTVSLMANRSAWRQGGDELKPSCHCCPTCCTTRSLDVSTVVFTGQSRSVKSSSSVHVPYTDTVLWAGLQLRIHQHAVRRMSKGLSCCLVLRIFHPRKV